MNPMDRQERLDKQGRFWRWYRTLPIVILIIVALVSVGLSMAPKAIMRNYFYPVSYREAIVDSANRHGLDTRLVCAIAKCESGWNANAVSGAGAIGLMQILSDRYPEEMLRNPAVNISVGARYLKKMEKMFESTAADPQEATSFALAAYNMGEGKLGQLIEKAREEGKDDSRWDSIKDYLPEGHLTRSYVDNVLNTYAYYSKVYPR